MKIKFLIASMSLIGTSIFAQPSAPAGVAKSPPGSANNVMILVPHIPGPITTNTPSQTVAIPAGRPVPVGPGPAPLTSSPSSPPPSQPDIYPPVICVEDCSSQKPSSVEVALPEYRVEILSALSEVKQDKQAGYMPTTNKVIPSASPISSGTEGSNTSTLSPVPLPPRQ